MILNTRGIKLELLKKICIIYAFVLCHYEILKSWYKTVTTIINSINAYDIILLYSTFIYCSYAHDYHDFITYIGKKNNFFLFLQLIEYVAVMLRKKN